MERGFPFYPRCPVCGDSAVNPAALGVRWRWRESEREVVGELVPSADHAGYEGRVHGGILSSLLDECLAWACAVDLGTYCMTGELKVRFARPGRLGEILRVTGRTGIARGPYARAHGEVRTATGELVARAQADFAAIPREEAERMRTALCFAPGDLDVLELRRKG